MENIELNIANEGKNYVNPKVLVASLEEIMEMNFEDLKSSVDKVRVSVTLENIMGYLNQAFDLQTAYPVREVAVCIKEERCMDAPQILRYFKTYISIVKNKTQTLLGIIEKINEKDFGEIKEYMDTLDLSFDEEGYILNSDVERLVKPTIYNLRNLHNKERKANTLNTYLTSRVRHFSREVLYPDRSLQLYSFDNEKYFDCGAGYVPLTTKQKEELEQNKQQKVKTLININN